MAATRKAMGAPGYFLCALSALWVLDATALEWCRADYLLSVTSKSDGLEIALVPQDDLQTERKQFEVLTLPRHFLSPECGELSFRCREIVSLTVEPSRHITLVPLLNGLLVVDTRFTADTQELKFGFNVTLPTDNCSPTAVWEIAKSLYTVCVNSSTRRLYLYEVHIDTAMIGNSFLSAALAEVTLADPPVLSNFVYASLDQHSASQRIYFVTGDSIYALIPLSYDYNYVGSTGSCNSVQNLVYLGEWVLAAYCLDGTLVYFDLDYEAILAVESNDTDGLPYFCPDSDINLRVYHVSGEFFLELTLDGGNSKEFYDLPGTNYHSGVCFATENNATYLVYIDSEEGLFAVNLNNIIDLRQISSKSCPASGCTPLLVIDGTYIVFQDKDSVTVVNGERNFTQVITAPHSRAELLTVIGRQYECLISESPKSKNPPKTAQNNDGSLTRTIAIAIPISGVVVLCGIVGSVAIVLVIVHIIKTKKRCGSSSEEASYSGHSSEVLVLSNTSSPTLTGKESRSPVDRNSLTSTGSEKPLDFKQQSRDRPAALDMVNSDLNSSVRHSTPVTDTSGPTEMEPGMIKTTCV